MELVWFKYIHRNPFTLYSAVIFAFYVKAQHACTLWPTFQSWIHHPLTTNYNTRLIQVQSYFFPPLFTGISKQIKMGLAVCQLHGAGPAAVSSHDPSLTQTDWWLQGRYGEVAKTGLGKTDDTETDGKKELCAHFFYFLKWVIDIRCRINKMISRLLSRRTSSCIPLQNLQILHISALKVLRDWRPNKRLQI